MADTHETTADIIAEKRRRADEIERDCAEKMRRGEMTSDQYARELVADIRREADRLEAACKRDKAAIEADALAVGGMVEAARKRERGDCAKLREALKHIKDRLPHMLQYMRVHWEDANAGGYFDELMLVIDAALSAPPRNCDRFATIDEARKAHEEYRGDYIMRASNKFDFPMKFEAWLFAPATEQEGGAK